MKFIHTADWQIGKQFANIKGDIAAFLCEARFDAILVAGDVFHTNEVSDTNIRKTLNTMQKIQRLMGIAPRKS